MQSESLVCSADGHLIEPADLWSTRLPQRLRGQALRYEHFGRWTAYIGEDGEAIVTSQRFARPDGTFLDTDGIQGRIRDLDADGIWAEVLHPNLGLHVYMPEHELAIAHARVYNDFAAEVCAPYQDRLLPLAVIPVTEVSEAVAEIERAASMGLRGIDLPLSAPEPYYSTIYEPIWAAAAAHGLPVSFHIASDRFDGDGRPIPRRRGGSSFFRKLSGSQLEQFATRSIEQVVNIPARAQRVLATLVSAGVLDRHPTLHVVFSEFNAHWLAGFMSGLDKAWTLGTGQPEVHMAGVYDRSAPPDEQPGMINHFEYNTKWPYPLTPSDYIRRQVHLTFMDDRAALELREFTGVDALMWSSDYPHPEGTWPRSRQAVDAQFARVDNEARSAILGTTVLRLYAGVR